MKKTTLIRTCVLAVSAVGLGVLGSSAQDKADYATLSGRPIQPSYAERQVAAQKATYNPTQPTAQTAAIQQTSFGKATADIGCGESGMGCAPTMSFPAPAAGAYISEGCASGSCPPAASAGWSPSAGGGLGSGLASRMQDRKAMRAYNAAGSCDTGNCGPGSGGRSGLGGMFSRRNQSCDSGNCGNGGSGGNFWSRSSASYQARNARLSQHLFGWLVPSGHGGQGSPPFGVYHTTYAQDADYFDQRDGQMYAAQGYGTNITVPLAPNVRHAYNYGWGMPSSRVTRVSNPAPYTSIRPLHW